MNLNDDAWAILNRDEKLSITLSLGHNKSSWEAGEIMKKSHYKYLEINARAERFLRMFTGYFEKWGVLIPPEVDLPNHFKDYLTMVIKERKLVRDACSLLDNKDYLYSGARDTIIEENLLKLKNSKKEVENELFDLILEFDRWNNFRVISKRFQQPSAFKRRNKTRELRQLKSTSDIHPYSVKKIREKFEIKDKKPGYYLTLIASGIPGGFQIIKVSPKSVGQISKLGFFLFEDRFDALSIADKIIHYLYPKLAVGYSPVLKGLKFWTPYREIISRAVNYDKVYNIIPNRKYFEEALFEQSLRKRKKEKRVKKRLQGD